MDASNGAGWLAALIGLWVLISVFFLGATGGGAAANATGAAVNATSGGANTGGGGSWLFWSNIISGILIAILAGYSAWPRDSGTSSSAVT